MKNKEKEKQQEVSSSMIAEAVKKAHPNIMEGFRREADRVLSESVYENTTLMTNKQPESGEKTTFFDLSDAEKKRIIGKSAHEANQAQLETILKWPAIQEHIESEKAKEREDCATRLIGLRAELKRALDDLDETMKALRDQ